jgi:hypothetical protein
VDQVDLVGLHLDQDQVDQVDLDLLLLQPLELILLLQVNLKYSVEVVLI